MRPAEIKNQANAENNLLLARTWYNIPGIYYVRTRGGKGKRLVGEYALHIVLQDILRSICILNIYPPKGKGSQSCAVYQVYAVRAISIINDCPFCFWSDNAIPVV